MTLGGNGRRTFWFRCPKRRRLPCSLVPPVTLSCSQRSIREASRSAASVVLSRCSRERRESVRRTDLSACPPPHSSRARLARPCRPWGPSAYRPAPFPSSRRELCLTLKARRRPPVVWQGERHALREASTLCLARWRACCLVRRTNCHKSVFDTTQRYDARCRRLCE